MQCHATLINFHANYLEVDYDSVKNVFWQNFFFATLLLEKTNIFTVSDDSNIEHEKRGKTIEEFLLPRILLTFTVVASVNSQQVLIIKALLQIFLAFTNKF